MFASPGQAQVTCGGITVDDECLRFPPGNYQCIDGNFNASALFGAQLLTPAAALTTPQFLVVKGKVTFDNSYTFAAGSEIVFVNNSSGFKVNGNQKLTIKSSYLHGCLLLWAGIEVLNAGEIIADNSTFEDARAAIILRNQSVITATGNTFKKNVCGILGMSANPAVNISILLGGKAGISGNTFEGDDALLEPIVPNTIDAGINSDASSSITHYPYIGIWIERVTALTIGYYDPVRPIPANVFRDYGQTQEAGVITQGVRSIQSSVTVQNSRFINFGLYDPANTSNNIASDGIFARNDGTTITSTVVIGTNQPYPYTGNQTFSNCWQDIRTIGTDLNVTDVISYRAGNSITVLMANSWQNAIVCEITDNRIDYYRSIGIEVGLYKSCTLKIEDNLIYDNDEALDPASRYGIRIKSDLSVPVSLPNGRVFNNEIISRSRLSGGAFWGIVLQQTADLTIESNQVLEDDVVTDLAAFYGIRTQQSPCDGLRIYSNTVTGATIGYTAATGIYVDDSVDGVVNCNETDKTNIGILFTDFCGNTDLSKNKFHFHDIGFSLGSNTFGGTLFNEIGPQKAKENRWFGTNSTIEAFAANNSSALSSIFDINSSNLLSDYWPLPRKIGTANDVFTWFVQLLGEEPSEDFTCLTSDGKEGDGKEKLTDTEMRLINGAYEAPLGYAALDWEARWKFADRMYQYPVIQAANEDAAQYYGNTVDATYTRLNSIYRAYLNRWEASTELKDACAALRTAIQQRFALDALLSESPEENTSLHEEMLAADAAIESAVAALNDLYPGYLTLVNQNMADALSNLEAVAGTEAFETDMKDLLTALVSSHFTDDKLTVEQTEKVQSIADKCRYSGGYAVLLARGFFEPQEVYEQDLDCSTEERSAANKAAVSYQVEVLPNPANQNIAVQTDKTFTTGTVQVLNSQGILLRTLTIKDQSTTIPVADLPAGTYFLEIRLDDHPGIHKSFVKTR